MSFVSPSRELRDGEVREADREGDDVNLVHEKSRVDRWDPVRKSHRLCGVRTPNRFVVQRPQTSGSRVTLRN